MSGDELDEADEMELSGADFEEGPRARLDAEEVVRRAREAYGVDGRPPLPVSATWPIFPFELEGLAVQALRDPVLPEPPRHGEEAGECSTCAAPDSEFVWTDERWRVSMPVEPAAVPTVTIHPRAHLDFGDLTEEDGAGLGALLVRGQRALTSIGGVGNVHIYKWGDGAAHLHVLLVARPRGMLQLKGMFLTTWMFILPPFPADEWRAIREHVGRSLAA